MTAPPDQRSDQIRRAAAELFFNHGFEATTTRGIAQVLVSDDARKGTSAFLEKREPAFAIASIRE